MRPVIVGIPTLNQFDRLLACIESALAGTIVPTCIMVVDNSGGAYPAGWQARYGERVEVYPSRRNWGVAKSWNELALQAAGYNLILSNDDLVFAPDTIEQLLAVAHTTPRAGIVSAIEGERFACFWLSRAAYQDVGPFDEQFWPAYFEDNDYHRRLTLAGWESPVAPSAVQHAGSATMRAYTVAQLTEHHARFGRCRELYVAKWGGLPGKERFTEPYGGAA